MMMFPSLLLMLLMSARTLQADAEGGTFSVRDPLTGNSLQCDRCRPGTYLREGCTSTHQTVCAPCPDGSFTELWNFIPKCLRCGVCGHNQVVKMACAPDADCKCECKEGFYYKESYDMCVPHSECTAGQGVLTKGSAFSDTACQLCPGGSFSDAVSALDTCRAHRSCDAPGMTLLLKGSAWHDSVCARTDSLNAKDAADYLTDILPAFFLHQGMNVKRLRRILHRLPGVKPTQASGQNLSISERIDAWVASASVSQIRQLPSILTKAGAEQAAERLQNKLHRIESRLSELGTLGNEVDVSLRRK